MYMHHLLFKVFALSKMDGLLAVVVVKIKVLKEEFFPKDEVHVIINASKISKESEVDIKEIVRIVKNNEPRFRNKGITLFSNRGKTVLEYCLITSSNDKSLVWDSRMQLQRYDAVIRISKDRRLSKGVKKLVVKLLNQIKEYIILKKL